MLNSITSNSPHLEAGWKYLSSLMSNDYEKTTDLIHEINLWKITTAKRIVVLNGKGNNGKSVFCDVLGQIFNVLMVDANFDGHFDEQGNTILLSHEADYDDNGYSPLIKTFEQSPYKVLIIVTNFMPEITTTTSIKTIKFRENFKPNLSFGEELERDGVIDGLRAMF